MIRTWGKSRQELVREIRRQQAAGLVGEAIGWLLVVVCRFLTGDHLDGKSRTNATWTTRATETYTRSGRASAWASLPRLERAAIRVGILLFAGLVRLAYAANPRTTRLALQAGALAFAVILVAYGISRLRRHETSRGPAGDKPERPATPAPYGPERTETDDLGRPRYHP